MRSLSPHRRRRLLQSEEMLKEASSQVTAMKDKGRERHCTGET
ncbi:MAG: hypothetical protein ACLUS5_19305 [Roseburia faecis]